MTKSQARKWLDDHGHKHVELPRKGQAVLNVPPLYMLRAGIDTCWRLVALGGGQFELREE